VLELGPCVDCAWSSRFDVLWKSVNPRAEACGDWLWMRLEVRVERGMGNWGRREGTCGDGVGLLTVSLLSTCKKKDVI
jgi:hypothetical protein